MALSTKFHTKNVLETIYLLLLQLRSLLWSTHIVGTVADKSIEWPFDDILFTQFCQGTEYVNGKWLRDNREASVYYGGGNDAALRPTNKSFVCCGWDARDWMAEEISNYCNPNNYYHEEYRGVDWGFEHPEILSSGGHACTCDEADNTRLTKSKREKYIWRPNNCQLRLWNATLFCEVLGDRTIIMIGDSTMQQSAGTLMAMLQSAHPRGMCSEKIIFGRSNDLSAFDIVDYMTRYKPSYTILNAGAHFYAPSDYYKKMHESMDAIRKYEKETYMYVNPLLFNNSESGDMEELNFIQYTTEKPKDHRFVWKTMNPAHLHCDNYTEPTNIYKVPTADDKFGWAWFHVYDKMMLKLAVEYGLDVIDMRPLYLRPDAHPGHRAWQWKEDCLHFCMPGRVRSSHSQLILFYH